MWLVGPLSTTSRLERVRLRRGGCETLCGVSRCKGVQRRGARESTIKDERSWSDMGRVRSLSGMTEGQSVRFDIEVRKFGDLWPCIVQIVCLGITNGVCIFHRVLGSGWSRMLLLLSLNVEGHILLMLSVIVQRARVITRNGIISSTPAHS